MFACQRIKKEKATVFAGLGQWRCIHREMGTVGKDGQMPFCQRCWDIPCGKRGNPSREPCKMMGGKWRVAPAAAAVADVAAGCKAARARLVPSRCVCHHPPSKPQLDPSVPATAALHTHSHLLLFLLSSIFAAGSALLCSAALQPPNTNNNIQ